MGSLERGSVANKVFPEVKNADFRVGFKTARGVHRGLSCHTEKRGRFFISRRMFLRLIPYILAFSGRRNIPPGFLRAGLTGSGDDTRFGRVQPSSAAAQKWFGRAFYWSSGLRWVLPTTWKAEQSTEAVNKNSKR